MSEALPTEDRAYSRPASARSGQLTGERPRRLRWSTLVRLLLALIALLLAGRLWFRPPATIDRPGAEARAAKMLAAYIEQTGEPPPHFTERRIVAWPDGWEFTWAYRPCLESAELRIFIRRSGAARYSLLPDCAPKRGFAVKPQRV